MICGPPLQCEDVLLCAAAGLERIERSLISPLLPQQAAMKSMMFQTLSMHQTTMCGVIAHRNMTIRLRA